jgi:hypothetical protein
MSLWFQSPMPKKFQAFFFVWVLAIMFLFALTGIFIMTSLGAAIGTFIGAILMIGVGFMIRKRVLKSIGIEKPKRS